MLECFRMKPAAHPHEKPHHPHWPLAALLFAFVFAVAATSVRDPSTWLRIKVGAKILADGALPKTDPFSFGGAGVPWTTHSWLADLLFAKADALGGPGLLIALTSAAAAGGFALLLPISHGSPITAACLLAGGAWASWAGFAQTPFAFDFLFFSLFLRLLRPRRRFAWSDALAGVGLTALWANLHGASAPLALWLVGLKVFKTSLRTAARERAGYWAMMIACALAFSWNPHGYGLFLHAFADAASGAGAWRASLVSPAGLFLAAGGIACWFTLQQEFVTTMAAATVIALAAVLPGLRPLGVLAACPTIALALGHALKPRDDTWPRVARWTALAAALFVAHRHAVTLALAPSTGYGAPSLAGAAHYLDASGVRGRMFNEPEAGAELIGLTGRQVFVDRRLSLYPEAFVRDAVAWPQTFRSLDSIYRFDYAVVRNRRGRDAARVIAEDPQWRLAYADDRALVYLKKDGANAWLVPQSPFARVEPDKLWPDSLDEALADPRRAPKVLEELDRWSLSAPDCAQALIWKAYALNRLKMGGKAERLLELARERPVLSWNPELRAELAAATAALGRETEARELARSAARDAERLGERALADRIRERFEPSASPSAPPR